MWEIGVVLLLLAMLAGALYYAKKQTEEAAVRGEQAAAFEGALKQQNAQIDELKEKSAALEVVKRDLARKAAVLEIQRRDAVNANPEWSGAGVPSNVAHVVCKAGDGGGQLPDPRPECTDTGTVVPGSEQR